MSKHRFLFIGLLILTTLLLRNPFSAQTEIPDFEPLPDTLHYIVPAHNFVHGQGFTLAREGKPLNINVPPFYSFALMPFIAINGDPRMFYPANVTLAFISAVIFYLILAKLTSSTWARGVAFLAFVSSYTISLYPQFAMAENLALPLFLLTLLLILNKVTLINSALAGLVMTSIYATKYAYLPTVVILIISFLLKIIFSQKRHYNLKSRILPQMSLFILGIGMVVLILQLFQGGVGHIPLINPFSATTDFLNKVSQSANQPTINFEGSFSAQNFQPNFIQYLAGLMGGVVPVAASLVNLIPVFIGLPSIFLAFLNPVRKKHRYFSLLLLTTGVVQLLTISTFFIVDARYIFHLIPMLLIIFVISLSWLEDILIKKKAVFLIYFLLIPLLLFLFWQSLAQSYQQIHSSLNGETKSKTYSFLLEANNFFTPDKFENDQKPVLISVIPPYITDFYTNKNYSVLPYAEISFFRGEESDFIATWGESDYSDIFKLYGDYINRGVPVYLTDFGTDQKLYHLYLQQFNKDLNNRFNLIPQIKGCQDKCNIYRLQNKTS